MDRLQRWIRRTFRGLWLSPDFRKLWASLTITAFGSQITNLALPLTAALLLHATPLQMGVLIALETLPFALVSLHAGVLLDRVRKLPIVVASDLVRGVALLAIPLAAFTGTLAMEILYVVGFFCGVSNVVGGGAHQVLIAQLAGRGRLVEANAKIALGETSSALIGPGLAGGLIQLLTAPFAIILDALTFFYSAWMLRRIRVPQDVPHPGPKASVTAEIIEGLKLVWHNRTLLSLALGLVGLIILKVVPAFSDFYASFGAELPFVTRMIVRVSEFIRGQFVLILIVVGAGIVMALAWWRRPANKARFDHLLLRVPMVGPIAAKFATSQMARTLATLLGGGLPLVNSLDIAAKSIGNHYMARQLDVVNARVREGESFAAALDARRVFPEVAVKMAEVGESTGALQEMLNTVADFFDEEIGTNMERFVTLVEPALLVIMGLVIAGLLLALYMPLFQLSSVLS